MNRNNEAHFKFSSPYGDSTPTYVRFLVAEHVFAPLWGWYTTTTNVLILFVVYAPLRGSYEVSAITKKSLEFSPPCGDRTYL